MVFKLQGLYEKGKIDKSEKCSFDTTGKTKNSQNWTVSHTPRGGGAYEIHKIRYFNNCICNYVFIRFYSRSKITAPMLKVAVILYN